MKILTKPEQFRIASPSIYGYEGSWTSWTEETECEIITHYDCVEDTVFVCEPGDSYTETKSKHDD